MLENEVLFPEEIENEEDEGLDELEEVVIIDGKEV